MWCNGCLILLNIVGGVNHSGLKHGFFIANPDLLTRNPRLQKQHYSYSMIAIRVIRAIRG